MGHSRAGLLIGWVLGLCAAASADELAARRAIVALLDAGWAASPQARAAADAQIPDVLAAAKDDVRAHAAVWLVLMQQRRYDDARARIEEHLAKAPDDLSAWRAKVWVLTILKNYPAAMTAADRLAALVAELPADEARADREELAGFLGRLLGYLSGPMADAVNQVERKALERSIVARLTEPERTLFEEGRNGVVSRFIALSDESAEARERALAAAKAEQDKTRADLAAERDEAAARIKDLDERRKRVQAALKTELDDLAKQDQPLVADLARLSSQASRLSTDLLVYNNDILRLQQLAAAEKDMFLKQQYLLEADRLAILASRLEAELAGVARLVQSIKAQRAALVARQTQAHASAAAQVDRIDREAGDLARREKRNEALERRASRPPTAASGKGRSLSAQATALSTYDAFPLEALKAELLESLR
jgi:hypothetical protein